ncbi:hypothetical protein Salat_2603500 [Sesamum alatum]|uniref:CASP-like protein n=1 Tax=Sesamum alatum TaxID=300844 RepID=A0AAE2CAP0_9LAMI|nr:hypothetical protein Salat_2603500 [Sesamum alatum]
MGDEAAAPPAPSNTTEWMRSIAETLKMLAIACFVAALWSTYIIDDSATRSSDDQVFESKVKMISDFLTYRYMLGSAVIGIVFNVKLFSLSISQFADPHQHRTLAPKYQLYNEEELQAWVLPWN